MTKVLVKGLAERRLPREIVHLPKLGFFIDAGMWKGTTELLRNGRLAELLKWRSEDHADILGWLAANPLYQFTLVATEAWLRMRFDGESPAGMSENLLRMKARAS